MKRSFLTILPYKSTSELRRHLDSLGDINSTELNLLGTKQAPLTRTHRRMYWSTKDSNGQISDKLEEKQIRDLQDLSCWRKTIMKNVVPDVMRIKEEEEELQADFDLLKSLEMTIPNVLIEDEIE